MAGDEERPFCVLCFQALALDSMKHNTGKLKKYLKTEHST